MHIAVVGRGMIGSAAARHLARAGHEVTLIGPDEPADMAAHSGAFGSHYDEGRITRSLDATPFWSEVSRASIARYAEIEAESGVRFFTECGSLIAGMQGAAPLQRIAEGAERDGIPFRTLTDGTLAETFPMFSFPQGAEGLFEPTAAGYINPRRLVAAQGVAAERAGARILRCEAQGIDEDGNGVRIATQDGTVRADRVLVAAGAFTGAMLGGAVGTTVYARTVVLLPVPDEEAHRLSAMPTLIWFDPDGSDPYLLPPIRYPDGRFYLKMGGDPVDRIVAGPEIGDWFRSGGDDAVGAVLEAKVRARMPGLICGPRRTAACVTSFSADDRAIIRALSSRIAVATAGCGRGAKCSDELGRRGADLVTGQEVPGAV
ncbi:N-methyl-l-tryptophan oxidase [Oceanicola sp. 22II-s10i]|uniref:NAD(P)/FAD-dependent oxidoreductase n=1 Tax=Oceanicola sp. 22II-s10i TaxID=1317116 RepID=UPI000B51EA00|nr:FAD-dependent oxidoreductase [Oceanicola sp. 22II-s10i]OWU86471.1 N-methyl-l-tryptophan oxidase [Oceanicola sp. 22II-s10i]